MQAMMPKAFAPGQVPPQAYIPPYQTNKGTLTPGQVIQVQQHTVTVERFLSQGGFAHVYLVRTPAPVNGTTQHVLKRMAVPDDNMLNEVRKEVDIMRVLRGHPNIVQFLDAAWHRAPNGTYEVFILMEFCAGGGIIDMMNRRLRERLTEGEILQIFVDVCEGLAAMHNLQPALLHRDLKVENILQASQNSFKLCDFGSATAVSRKPPATTAEIRALEADLNKHTTLQYRAPEMVDPYLRRPIDEKSDVWALGVLLYKLCYYTTPFEEHGPLAILNVQYKIPPYPVYSHHLNSLIASMLREHGAQRPTVFEVLNMVHQMRGTKPLFRYNQPKQHAPQHIPTVDNLITFRSQGQPQMANPGTVARQKVLDAIAPMRRGRPGTEDLGAQKSGPAGTWDGQAAGSGFDMPDFQPLPKANGKDSMDSAKPSWDIGNDQSSGPASLLPKPARESRKMRPKSTGPWDVLGKSSSPKPFSPTGFGDSFDSSFMAPSAQSSVSSAKRSPQPLLPKPLPSRLPTSSPRDAFAGLGTSPSGIPIRRRPSESLGKDKAPTNMGSPSPKHSPSIGLSASPLQTSDKPLSAEERFPSIEELEFGISSTKDTSPLPSRTTPSPRLGLGRPPLGMPSKSDYASGLRPDHTPLANGAGVRSQQVTGTAMKEHNLNRGRHVIDLSHDDFPEHRPIAHQPTSPTFPSMERSPVPSRVPMLSRRHRSSLSIKNDPKYQRPEPVVQHRSPAASTLPPKDWLTGDDQSSTPSLVPTPTQSKLSTPATSEARRIPSTDNFRPPAGASTSAFRRPPSRQNTVDTKSTGLDTKPVDVKPVDTKPAQTNLMDFGKARPHLIDTAVNSTLTDNWSPVEPRTRKYSSEDDDGPEEASPRKREPLKPDYESSGSASSALPKRKGRQSSVHELVDLWGSVTGSPSGKPAALKASGNRRTSGSFVPAALAPPAADLISFVSPNPVKPLTEEPVDDWRMISSSRVAEPVSSVITAAAPSTPSSGVSGPRPRPTASSPNANRPRPQSLFIFPGSSSADSGATSPSLAPPIRQRSPRRGSISDMVSRFEALGSPGSDISSSSGRHTKAPSNSPEKAKPPQPTGPKPNLMSTSPVMARFTGKISPSATPNATGPLPSAEGLSSTRPMLKPQVTPSSNLQAPLSTSFDGGWSSSTTSNRDPSEPVVRSASPIKRPSPQPSPSLSNNSPLGSLGRPAGDSLRPPTPPAPHSPSPERPYQGVGRLIDQWQKKTEEAAGAAATSGTGRAKPPLGPRGLRTTAGGRGGGI